MYKSRSVLFSVILRLDIPPSQVINVDDLAAQLPILPTEQRRLLRDNFSLRNKVVLQIAVSFCWAQRGLKTSVSLMTLLLFLEHLRLVSLFYSSGKRTKNLTGFLLNVQLDVFHISVQQQSLKVRLNRHDICPSFTVWLGQFFMLFF